MVRSLVFWALLSTVARASSVSTELSAGSGVGANATADSTFYRQRIAASIDVSDTLTLRASFTGLEAPTTARDRSADLLAASLGVTWELSPAWTVGIDALGTLPGPTISTLAIPDPAPFRAQSSASTYRSQVTNVGVQAFVEHAFTPPTDDDEVGMSLDAGVARYDASTTLAKVLLDGAPVTLDALTARCEGPLCADLLADFRASTKSTLLQGSFGASGFASFQDGTWYTDVNATGYVFSDDPATFGSTTLLFSGYSIGEGIPLLPLRASFGAGVVRKLGDLSIDASGQWGRFAGSGGSSARGVLRVRYRVSRAFSFWLGSGSFVGVYDTLGTTVSLWGIAGARVRF